MKVSLLLMGVMSLGFTACATPPAAKMTVKVLDEETSAPMSNCVVQTRFLVKSHWNDPDEYDEQKCISDADGICVFSGTDDSFGYGGGVLASNYYRSSFKVPYTGVNRMLNRWEPWNPVIEVRMRKIKNPVPMVHYFHSGRWIPMPDKGNMIGFDLELRDWIAPYGRGKTADFIFHPYRTDTDEEIRFGYTLSFSNPLDGIQKYIHDEELRSSFIFPYEALTNGYVTNLQKYKRDPVRGRVETDMDNQNNYIFRIRSHEDENGNIVGSYGRIKGEITMSGQFGLQFEYWFNPVPNERSLEWNGVNLFKKK